MRGLTPENYRAKIEESVSDTLKEQIQSKLLDPLFNSNMVHLPPGKNLNHVIETLVPGDDVQLLASIYQDLAQLGIESPYYIQFLQIVNTFWGG